MTVPQLQESEDWGGLSALESLSLSDIANLCPKPGFLAVSKLPRLQRVSLRGSMPADSQVCCACPALFRPWCLPGKGAGAIATGHQGLLWPPGGRGCKMEQGTESVLVCPGVQDAHAAGQ